MKIPFVGGYNTVRSAVANIERTLNCYLELNGATRALEALYGTPGLTLRATLATSPVRGGIKFSDSYSYWVAGNKVYRMDTSYTATALSGTIGTSSGEVSMASNGTEVILVDGNKGWLITGTTLAEITDVDFPDTVTRATFQDGYFVVSGNGTQSIYWNETINSGTSWNGLDYASAEGNPDNVLTCVSDHRELWLFGSRSAEVWVNTGDADQLFQRSGNTYLEQGTIAAGTVKAMNNTVYWLGANTDGQGIVFKAEGYNPSRISNHALEQAIRGYSTITDAFAYTYQLDGHSFYVLVFPTANKTWVYDASIGDPDMAWFQWSYRKPSDNSENRHRSNCHVFFNGKHLVGDWENGKVYSLEMEVYTDNGDPIRRERVTQTLAVPGKRLFFPDLEIDMETGVGTASGDGSDPQLMLEFSDNGGRSWSTTRQASMGTQGDYDQRVRFSALGATKLGKGRVWRIYCTDPVKFALFGADSNVSQGT